MGWRSTLSVAVAVGAVSFTAGRVFSQDTKPAAPSKEDMEKMCAEMARPVEQHKAIATGAGDWDCECNCWFEGPEGPATKSKSTFAAKSVLNGLYLMSEHKGEMMGKPYEGVAFTGYSKEKQKYVAVWVDSMSSTPMVLYGTADAAGKVITFEGEKMTMMGMTYTPRWIERHDDADHMTFEMWSKYEGAPDYVKEMEMKSTRKK
jgi:uncharacterized protein DUF1579